MTKFIEYLNSNIIEITSNNVSNYENNFEESFQISLDQISNFMQKIGIQNDVIEDVSDSLKTKFKDLIEKGITTEVAYKETFELVSDILSSSIPNDSSANVFNDQDNKYDLSYAHSSINDKSLLIDDAISKGMTFKEAVNFVNSQVNPSKSEEFGPPNFADSVKDEFDNKILTKSEEEMNLDKIEADMDEHANKKYMDGSVDVKSSSVKDSFIDKYNDKLEEDDLS